PPSRPLREDQPDSVGAKHPCPGEGNEARNGDARVAQRIDAFRRQLAKWQELGRCDFPIFALVESERRCIGRCFSCGEAVAQENLRCEACREAALCLVTEQRSVAGTEPSAGSSSELVIPFSAHPRFRWWEKTGEEERAER